MSKITRLARHVALSNLRPFPSGTAGSAVPAVVVCTHAHGERVAPSQRRVKTMKQPLIPVTHEPRWHA